MRKKQPIKPTYYFDTPKGIDEFTKALYEDGNMTEDEFKKMNRDTKVAMLKDEYSKLKPYRADDPSSYPSNEEQRQRLFNISSLEKSLGIKGDNFTRFTKTGAIPYDKSKKKPDLWQDVIYKSMNPIERGQWNKEQRKKGFDGKTGKLLPKVKPEVKPEGPFIYDGASNTIKSEKQLKTEFQNTPVKVYRKETPPVSPVSTIPTNTGGVNLGFSPGVDNVYNQMVIKKSEPSVNQIIKKNIEAKDKAFLKSMGGKPGGIMNMDLILGVDEDFFRKNKG